MTIYRVGQSQARNSSPSPTSMTSSTSVPTGSRSVSSSAYRRLRRTHVGVDAADSEPVAGAAVLRVVQNRRAACQSSGAGLAQPVRDAEYHPHQSRWARADRSPARVQVVRRLSDSQDRSGAEHVLSRRERRHLYAVPANHWRQPLTGRRAYDVLIEEMGSYRNDPLEHRRPATREGFQRRLTTGLACMRTSKTSSTSARRQRAQNRYPSAAISGNTVLFGSATAVTAARQVTFGARWSF